MENGLKQMDEINEKRRKSKSRIKKKNEKISVNH